jgi:hypothetical protein
MRLEPVVERMMTLHDGTVHGGALNAVDPGRPIASRVAEPNGTGGYR